jgi:dTDP-4-dehydrorhamnose reductase
MKTLELWGGYECTVNRIGDRWRDQTIFSGHEDRSDDIELFASLGMKSLRYPALWERVSPDCPEQQDFRWTDERLAEMRRLGINPILTLCHHGSGPHYTSLVDPSFATGLASHAAAVARRYPWVRDYTPVNEPLTTARFSALYGYWYPHTKDEGLFWTALLNEIDATRLAMREIRKVNPDARLIQTDDLGYCHATPPLQCEADFQNERRWIGWDLLCGMVTPGHALWDRLASFGLEDRLWIIANDPCPPDVIGINHYLASERFRDHRLELHGDRALADRDTGDCAGVPFVDVDAIRNREEGVLGLPALIEQAWDRYGRTISITECHNGATREEQARWFIEVWEGAQALRERGVDLVSVTAWALLGSHDWNRMVTRFIGHYEPGVFDVRGGEPRPTLMATVLAELAAGRKPQVPAIAGKGWWQRETRFLRGPKQPARSFEIKPGDLRESRASPIVILGEDDDNLVRMAVRACELRGLTYARVTGQLEEALAKASPWAVLDARDHDALCGPVKRSGRGDACRSVAAAACGAREVPIGRITGTPSWAAAPIEAGVLEVRTGELFMPWDGTARAVQMLEALDRGRTVRADAGRNWTPVYGPDVVDLVLDLLIDGMTGMVSASAERMTELDFARTLAVVAESDASLIAASGQAEAGMFNWTSSPRYLPPAESSIERLVREARAVRKLGITGLTRGADEPHLEDPTAPEEEFVQAAE